MFALQNGLLTYQRAVSTDRAAAAEATNQGKHEMSEKNKFK